MGDFAVIETGFNCADETINFGTRSIGLGSLYEISTVACLKSSTEVSDSVINSLVKNGNLILSIDKSFKLFGNTELSSITFNAEFDSTIVTFSVSRDGRFLMVCLQNGFVNVFDISNPMDGKCIFSKSLLLDNLDEFSYISSFVEDFCDYSASFIIVISNGKVYRIFCNAKEDIEVNLEEMYNFNTIINDACYMYPMILARGREIHIFNVETKTILSATLPKLKCIFPLGLKYIALDHDGFLISICSLTLVMFPIEYDFLLEDILVIDDGRKNQILAITKCNERAESFLQLLNTDLSQVYSLKISYPVHLIRFEVATDDFLFLSKVYSNGSLSELRLQCVYETEPELRLTRLIRRQRFQEAEQFAKTFNIDPAIILKARAQLLVDKPDCSTDDISNLIRLMDAIDDEDFKLQCCSNVDCSSFADVRKILNYGTGIIPKSNCENKDEILCMKKNLTYLLFKFDTYMVLSNMGDIQSWYKFSTCDLIEELKLRLKNYHIADAIIIYNRLDKKTVDELTDENIEEILLILNNLPTDVYRPFLPTFIPITMSHRPTSLAIFVKWLHNKIFQLEKRDAAHFPENGIELAEDILKLLKVEKSGCMSFQRQCTLNKNSLDDLASLMDGLTTLKNLKCNFRINIPLSEYLQGPKVLIRTLLNIVMTPEEINYFLKEFLYTYMLQNQFDPDVILFEEIKDLIKYDDYWVYIVEAILNYISSIKIKLEAILEILQNSHVPWNDVIRKIGRNALQYSHPLVAKIKEILKDEPRLVILRNPKYKIKEKQINFVWELRQIINRIIYIDEPSMVDDIYQLCQTANDKHEANIILAQHFIMKGNLDKAMSIVDNNPKQEIYECAKYLLLDAEHSINYQLTHRQQMYKTNYYNVLTMLSKRITDTCDDSFKLEEFKDKVLMIRAVYNVNEIFQKKITTEDLISKSRKKTLFDALLKDFAENVDKGSSNISDILNTCTKLGLYFSIDKESVLIKLCEEIGKFEVVLKAAEHLQENECDSKNLCLIAVLIMKYMGSQSKSLLEESFNDSNEGPLTPNEFRYGDDLSESDLFMYGLKLSKKIVTKALLKAQEEEILEVMEVMNWIDTCFYVTNQGSSLQSELYRSLYIPAPTIPSHSTFLAIKNCFQMYTGYVGKFKNPNTAYICYFNDNTSQLSQEQLLREMSSLGSTIENFCREGQHLTAFKLLQTLGNSLGIIEGKGSKAMKSLKTITYTKCLPQLIHVVVSSKNIDVDLLFNLLLENQKDYLKFLQYYLKMFKRQPRKLYDLATVGIRLLEYHQETSGKDVMIDAAITCKWWKKLKIVQNKIPYEEFFKVNSDNRLRQLIGLEAVDVKLIKQYCEDYKLDEEKYYKYFVKSCLVNWKPDYECKTDLDGKKTFIIHNDEHVLYSKCQEIISVIVDKAGIFAMMEKILNMANFYHYEVFICIFKILANNSQVPVSRTVDLLMLIFLKKYQRFSLPSQREKEEWYSAFPDSQALDPVSEFRLPFTKLLFTFDVWSIIRPEINLKSYKCWFDATNILQKNLKKDDICVYAVKQVVSSGLLGNNLSTDWSIYPKLEDLLQEVDMCVQHISDLERATSVIYHLMYHTPNGADKVNAAQMSFKYASMYKEKNPDSANVEKAFIKVRNKYYGFSAMHILHKFNLADEKYIKSVSQPDSLVEDLYMDDRILKKAESVNFSCPDINKAVDALAEFFGLPIQKIRYNLLNSWLNSSEIDVDLDSTATFFAPSSYSTQLKTFENDDHLKRAAYLCGSGDQTFWQKYLLKVGSNEDDTREVEQKSLSFKAKALKCFCAITDEDTIANMTKLSYNEFLNYVDKLSLLSELECLGVSLNVETLDQYNKKELLKRLSQMGKPLSVKVMGTICITYFMEENRYWEFIVNNAIKHGMIAELKQYVDFLKDKYDRCFYVKAWQVIIDNSFQQVNFLPQEQLDEIYINNFLMIQSCPVLFSLNFEKIVQKCIDSKKYQYAAVLLQYLPEETRNNYKKNISENKTLLLDLDNLDRKGIWGVRNIKSWYTN